jgi:hypothetical protein
MVVIPANIAASSTNVRSVVFVLIVDIEPSFKNIFLVQFSVNHILALRRNFYHNS